MPTNTTDIIFDPKSGPVGGFLFKGPFDASLGVFPGAGLAVTGWVYKCTVAGTVGGEVFSVGDTLYASTDNASTTTFAGNWVRTDSADAVSLVFGRLGNIVATNGDYNASQITLTPAGSLSSTDTQAGLEELDTEKLSKTLPDKSLFYGDASNVATPTSDLTWDEATGRLHVVGSIQITDGQQAARRILQSDASGVGTWVDAPPAIEDWVTATAYTIGQLLIASNRFYKVLVAHTSASISADVLAGNLVEVSPAGAGIADWVTATAYTAGSYLNAANKLYKVLADHTSDTINNDLTANNIVEVSPDTTAIKAWAATTPVVAGELRSATLAGTTVYLLRLTAGTTGAAFNAAEAADWKYLGQEQIADWTASSLYINKQLAKFGGQLLQSASTRTSTATFNAVEQAEWTRLTTDSARPKLITADYTATDNDDYLVVSAATAAVTVTIPTTLTDGKRITVTIDDNTNPVTIASTAIIRTNGTLGTSESFASTYQYSSLPYIVAAGKIRIYA